MKQNKTKKLTKLTSAVLAAAMVLSALPFNYAAAAETKSTVIVNQKVANQVQIAYLADSNGYFVQNASVDQVGLPFSPELYYGRSLLSTGGQQAWDYVVRELLAFNPTKEYDNLERLQNGSGRLTFNLKELGIEAPIHDIKNFNGYLVNSEPRMFHITGLECKYDREGTVETVSFYIQSGYMKDNAYQNTLLGMEKRTSEFLSLIDERMTDAQKVAVLYNKFNSSTHYTKNAGHWIMTGPLLYGGGICGGYSWAFQYLLQRAGIEAIYTTGDTDLGYHAWNYMNIDGKWYFADSTWGSNRWLLKGESSLKSHRRYNTFPKMPTLSKTDYDLSLTKFNANDVEANENIDQIIKVVKDALNDNKVNIAGIRAIVAGNPANTTFSGMDTEVYVKNIIEKQFANIPGTFEIVIHNSTDSTTADEIINNNLTITYQQEDGGTTYTYKKGKVSKR